MTGGRGIEEGKGGREIEGRERNRGVERGGKRRERNRRVGRGIEGREGQGRGEGRGGEGDEKGEWRRRALQRAHT